MQVLLGVCTPLVKETTTILVVTEFVTAVEEVNEVEEVEKEAQ